MHKADGPLPIGAPRSEQMRVGGSRDKHERRQELPRGSAKLKERGRQDKLRRLGRNQTTHDALRNLDWRSRQGGAQQEVTQHF